MNNKVVESLRSFIGEDNYRIWFGGCSITQKGPEGGLPHFVLSSTSQFRLDKIKSDFYDSICNALLQCYPSLKGDLSLTFELCTEDTVKDRDPNEEKQSSSPFSSSPVSSENSAPDKPQGTPSRLISYLNFDRYVHGDFNHIAYEVAKRVTEKIGQISPFYIHSKVGMGKTHLLHAIGNYYKQKFPFLSVLYINPNDFVEDYTQGLFQKNMSSFRIKYRSVDVLLIDDVQFFSGKEKSSVEFFHLFNEIYTPEKQLVFCSDQSPETLENLDDRLKSRLVSSVVAEIEDLKPLDKRKLIDFYLNENAVVLKPILLDFVLDHLPNDVRVITGIVKSLCVHYQIYGEELSIDFLRKNLSQLKKNVDNIVYNPTRLLESICNYSKISLKEIRSPRRDHHTSFYRQLAMYLLRTKLDLSLSEIGRLLGGKNTSSVHTAVRNFEERLFEDESLKSLIEKVLTF